MDSRMTHTHGTVPYQQQDHSHNATGLDAGGEGDNGGNHNQHRDKHSVLKKVKEKAKKIKDTLKPHSHGTHAHEGEGHEATPDDDGMDEEGGDDEDERIIHHDQDPQRRAPLVAVPSAGESAMSYNEGELEGSAAAAAAGKPIRSGDESAVKGLAELASVPSGPFSSGTGSGLLSPVLEDAEGRKLKEDPHAPKDKSDHDYSQVTDPTASGGGDAGNSQILKSMDKMNIYGDKEAAKREFPSAGSHDQFSPAPNKDIKATAQTSKPASMTVEYGKKIAATVAGKLSPAYDKVVEVGASAVSRVQGGTTETDESGIVNDKDKRVSVKEYFAEKLRPGEEDRALSQVISEVLHKQQKVGEEAEAETGAGEVVNRIRSCGTNVNYNSAAPPAGAAAPAAAAAAAAPAIGGTSVVDKLKDAVGSWFGKPQPTLSYPKPYSTAAGAASEFSDSGEIGEEDAAAAEAAAGEARAAN